MGAGGQAVVEAEVAMGTPDRFFVPCTAESGDANSLQVVLLASTTESWHGLRRFGVWGAIALGEGPIVLRLHIL